MRISIKNMQNEEVGKAEVSEKVFGAEVKNHLLHSVVRMQLANRRRGTASVKTRSMVKCSGKKPWSQKGTGRARAGSNASPLMRGGGIIFGPEPKIYNSKLTKKTKKAALQSALSMKLKSGRLVAVEDISPKSHKTREMIDLLSRIRPEKGKTLLVIHERNENVLRGARNIPNVKVTLPEGLNVYDLIRYPYVVCTKASLERVERRAQ